MGTYEFDLWIFMLAAFLGFQLIRGVSPLLHTPLMSLTNAISAITVVGAILLTGEREASTLSRVLGFTRRVSGRAQRGERLSDHRSHAEDVQETGAGQEMKLDDTLLPIIYMLAAMGFILAIKWLNSPATARRGVIVGEIGMLLAVVGTLLRFEVVNYQWILVAFFLGAAVGVPIAYMMPMTAVPQRTAFSHACGALASALIGTAEYYKGLDQGTGLSKVVMIALIVETLLGFLTFTASMMAFGKLQEVLAQRPITYRGPELRQLGSFCGRGGHRSSVDRFSGADGVVSIVRCAVAVVRRAADHTHRRRGHADRDRAAEFLRRIVGQRDGIRAEQQAADRGGRAGWVVRFYSVDHHVPRHEPVVHQTCCSEPSDNCRSARRRAGKLSPCIRPARKKPRRSWNRLATWS